MTHHPAHHPIPPAVARDMLRAPDQMRTQPVSRTQAWATLKAASGHPITARQRVVLRVFECHGTLANSAAATRLAAFDMCPRRDGTPEDAA